MKYIVDLGSVLLSFGTETAAKTVAGTVPNSKLYLKDDQGRTYEHDTYGWHPTAALPTRVVQA